MSATLSDGRWIRVRCAAGKLHHVNAATPGPDGSLSSLCTRVTFSAEQASCCANDQIVTCALCSVLWRNVYRPYRYVVMNECLAPQS